MASTTAGHVSKVPPAFAVAETWRGNYRSAKTRQNTDGLTIFRWQLLAPAP
jgi:hypothetical protein